MFLWRSDIYVGSGTLGTLLDGFLWSLISPWRSSLADPYICLDLTESYRFSGQLQFIPSCK